MKMVPSATATIRARPVPPAQARTSLGHPARRFRKLACRAESEGVESEAVTPSSPELSALTSGLVRSCSSAGPADAVSVSSLWDAQDPSKRHVVVCLSHFGDLTSWEYAQKLRDSLEAIDSKADGISVIGLGTVEAGRKFAELLNFPTTNLYAVNDVELYVRLGFSEGAFPDQNLNEYVRLLPMLAGIESPGTLQEVIRGYVGDRDAKQIFDRSPFDVLGKGYQRPFELATLRLSNMIRILPNWGELVPNSELICQQGGTLVFQGSSLVHLQNDTGILKYASIDDLLAFLESS